MVNKRNHVTRSLSATTPLGPLKWLGTKILHVGRYRLCASVRGIIPGRGERIAGGRGATCPVLSGKVADVTPEPGTPRPADFSSGGFPRRGSSREAACINKRTVVVNKPSEIARRTGRT